MKTVLKTLGILENFLEHGPELGISELSSLSGVNVSTAYRIVSILTKRGYLKQSKNRGKYSLGLKILDFNSGVGNIYTIRGIVYPYLEKLLELVNESVSLVVFDGNQIVRTDFLRASHVLGILNPSEKVSLHATSAGKIMLANLGKKELKRLLASYPLETYTPNTITDPSELTRHLMMVKRENVAFDDEERTIGIRSIAGPIREHSGNVIAAIVIVGPTVRLTREKIRELVSTIKNISSEISHALGYHE